MSGTNSNVPQLVHQNAMTAAQAAAGGGGGGDNTPVTPPEEKCDNSSTAGETTHTSGIWVTETKNFIKIKNLKKIFYKNFKNFPIFFEQFWNLWEYRYVNFA